MAFEKTSRINPDETAKRKRSMLPAAALCVSLAGLGFSLKGYENISCTFWERYEDDVSLALDAAECANSEGAEKHIDAIDDPHLKQQADDVLDGIQAAAALRDSMSGRYDDFKTLSLVEHRELYERSGQIIVRLQLAPGDVENRGSAFRIIEQADQDQNEFIAKYAR